MGWLSLFITAVAFLAIGVIFSPKLTTLSTYVKLAHLLCFSTAFGAALWVTFIGGIIIMYRYSMSAIWKEFSSIARRFITVVAFLAIGVIFSPQTLGSKSTTLSTFLKLAHLLSFSTAFGAALWVTFIGGNIMFKNMSRHQLGDLQSKMFPAYFLMLGVCCAVSVTSFDYLHPWKTSSTTERFQLGFLLSSFLCNLANLFVFAPMIIEMMKQRHKVEIENNIGEEELLWSNDAEVAAMNKKFGMIYGLSALANIMSIGCLAIHSMYLAGKIDL